MKNLLAIFLLLLFYACSNNQADESKTENLSDGEKAMKILQEQGWDMSKIVLAGNKLIIDGDGELAVNTVLQSKRRSKQWQTEYIMSQNNAADVKIRLANNIPKSWKRAINRAIRKWNNINGTRLAMRKVSNGEDIYIRMATSGDNLSSNTIARAEFPDAGGNAGDLIRINSSFNSLSSSKKLFTITHEIGHCIGFRHTNWFDRNSNGISGDTPSDREPELGTQHIPGTPTGLDGNSVMNAIVAAWNGFSQYDEIAVQNLYPGN